MTALPESFPFPPPHLFSLLLMESLLIESLHRVSRSRESLHRVCRTRFRGHIPSGAALRGQWVPLVPTSVHKAHSVWREKGEEGRGGKEKKGGERRGGKMWVRGLLRGSVRSPRMRGQVHPGDSPQRIAYEKRAMPASIMQ